MSKPKTNCGGCPLLCGDHAGRFRRVGPGRAYEDFVRGCSPRPRKWSLGWPRGWPRSKPPNVQRSSTPTHSPPSLGLSKSIAPERINLCLYCLRTESRKSLRSFRETCNSAQRIRLNSSPASRKCVRCDAEGLCEDTATSLWTAISSTIQSQPRRFALRRSFPQLCVAHEAPAATTSGSPDTRWAL
jgi:hypothetical protein